MQSPLRVDVWSDYVCPFSYLQLPIIEQLQERYGQSIEWRWHAFELHPAPLPTPAPDADYLRMTWSRAVLPMADKRQLLMKIPPIQPHSRAALEAANCARRNGCFGEFHRAVFQAFFEFGQDISQTDVLLELARNSGLDPQALQQALADEQFTSSVVADENLADKLGLRAVPVMLLRKASEPLEESKVLNGTLPLQRLVKEIDALLT